MKVIAKLPKEVIDFYECHATIVTERNEVKYMFLPIWIASTDKDDEFELLSIEKPLPKELRDLFDSERNESQAM